MPRQMPRPSKKGFRPEASVLSKKNWQKKSATITEVDTVIPLSLVLCEGILNYPTRSKSHII